MKQDSYRHKGLRKAMVEKIATRGINNRLVLQALNQVPRHYFLPDSVFDVDAYDDKPFSIGAGQTISQPFTVAYQTELIDLVSGHKVLEVGTGSGYQTAILLALGARVFSIERQQSLFRKTEKLYKLLKMGTPRLFFGDGFEGLPSFAPFDRIIVTAGANELPEKLIGQLAIGGKMVIPLGGTDSQQMKRFTRSGETEIFEETFDQFSFVPMLQGKAWAQ